MIDYYIHPDHENIAIVQVENHVVGGNDAMEFSALLRSLVETGVNRFIVDLGNVELMNSTGLGMLVSGMSTVKKHGGAMIFIAVPPKVNALLTMTHLNSVFDCRVTLEDALL